jgi:acetyl esterase/lipase
VVLLAPVSLLGCGDREQVAPTTSAGPEPRDCTTSGVEVDADIAYLERTGAAADLTRLDVHRPVRAEGCGPTPVLVWVHGGGWQVGDRRQQLEDKVELLTSMGWTLVSTNYRLSPEVRYPVHNDDVAAAVAWVLDHAAELDLEPDRLTVMGHSAGAGIVAAVATDARHLERAGRSPHDLACAVMLDTEGYDVESAAGEGRRVYLEAFGDDPTVWADASPMRNLDASVGTPRSLVVTRGSPARRSTAQRFVDGLERVGVDAELLDVSPLDHAGVNRAVGAEGDDVVTPRLVAFLRGC